MNKVCYKCGKEVTQYLETITCKIICLNCSESMKKITIWTHDDKYKLTTEEIVLEGEFYDKN